MASSSCSKGLWEVRTCTTWRSENTTSTKSNSISTDHCRMVREMTRCHGDSRKFPAPRSFRVQYSRLPKPLSSCDLAATSSITSSAAAQTKALLRQLPLQVPRQVSGRSSLRRVREERTVEAVTTPESLRWKVVHRKGKSDLLPPQTYTLPTSLIFFACRRKTPRT